MFKRPYLLKLKIKLILIFIFISFISNISYANTKQTILIFGDSLVSGYGIDLNKDWVTLLEKHLQDQNFNYQVINSGISGDTSANGLYRIEFDLNKYQPDITIIGLGSNDALRGLNNTALLDNLSQIINLTLSAKSKILLIGFKIPVNYGDYYREQFESVFTQLAAKYKISFMPFLLKDVALVNKYLQDDGLHPNNQAQPIILKNIWPYLEHLLE